MKILVGQKNFKKFFLQFMYKPCIFGKESQGNFLIHVQTMKMLVWQKNFQKFFFAIHVQTMYF